ncbi:unnamed protein product [Mesocestoides corti]|nr:unnamed protein product [Mesocestoides corti]
MKEQLFYLLQQLSEQPGLSAELPSLMDCVFVLYTNLSHLTHPERLKIFLIIYNLAHQECSNLKANGGCLSFSFLLMRIFDCSLVSEEVTLRLIQLQTLVSIKIAEDPGLMANETVIAIHRGLFTADLLKPEARTTFSLHVCMEILKLVTHLHELSRLVDNANVFPSSLKGILLACLLRCFTNLNVLQHLKATGSYKIAVESCISLESIDLEEDPSIRQAVLHCWNNLLEETDTQNSTELSDLSAQLKSHFRLVPSAQIGGAVCPSCNECLHDLLEDIVLAKRPAGDVDCTGD